MWKIVVGWAPFWICVFGQSATSWVWIAERDKRLKTPNNEVKKVGAWMGPTRMHSSHVPKSGKQMDLSNLNWATVMNRLTRSEHLRYLRSHSYSWYALVCTNQKWSKKWQSVNWRLDHRLTCTRCVKVSPFHIMWIVGDRWLTYFGKRGKREKPE